MDSLKKIFLIFILGLAAAVPSAADVKQTAPLTDAEWEKLGEHVSLLDKISFVPSLLPVIMKHREALELSDEQVAAFRNWRKQHYQRMVDVMNEIIERRIVLSKGALNPAVVNEDLVREQRQILQVQQKLLEIRLSCRDLVMKTFSPDQWNNFAFVLEEYPHFAGLMQ